MYQFLKKMGSHILKWTMKYNYKNTLSYATNLLLQINNSSFHFPKFAD